MQVSLIINDQTSFEVKSLYNELRTLIGKEILIPDGITEKGYADYLRIRLFQHTGNYKYIRVPINVKSVIGRNDPCHCGSGKKYKKCCGSV